MLSRRNISGFMAVVMFAMQLLLAQHYVVHFNEELGQASSAIAGKKQTGDDGAADKICQICVLSKSFSHLTLFAVIAAIAGVLAAAGVQALPAQFLLQKRVLVYSARGPPSFLS